MPGIQDNLSREWLEADGLGGFASGTVAGVRTRRYHALLLCGADGPAGRRVLVNGFDLHAETPAGELALSAQAYAPGVVSPDGAARILGFTTEPWPRWEFDLGDGLVLTQEIFAPHETGAVVVVWRLSAHRPGVRLRARPFLSGRDYHALHRENAGFRFEAEIADDGLVLWRPYEGVPGVRSLANAAYAPDPLWYRNFEYTEEAARGLDSIEDLASPGRLVWDLSAGPAVWILSRADVDPVPGGSPVALAETVAALADRERARRAAFASPLHRAADAYLVRRGSGRTIVAGYPWFTDWGRDTFIALRGLCLATGRLELARDILLSWTGSISLGMLPNRFPDGGEQPEFNSVDASLWFIVAVHDFLQGAARARFPVSTRDRSRLRAAVAEILEGFSGGTRHGIHATSDGLLAAGEPGVQLTWMDAKVGDWVVTPRIGKPVEIQALWLNALRIAIELGDTRWHRHHTTGLVTFRNRFWNEAEGGLHDVIDVNHEAGQVDSSLRPNQIFAVGGLPFPLIEGRRAASVVALVEHRLLTPLGLRSLAPHHPDYRPIYEGGVRERDGAYHQGTVWPWLIGPFVEAWLRVHAAMLPAERADVCARFLLPLHQHLGAAGLGHVSEIADADSPHTPRGCPWQAWSLGEVLRVQALVADLRAPASTPRARSPRHQPVS